MTPSPDQNVVDRLRAELMNHREGPSPQAFNDLEALLAVVEAAHKDEEMGLTHPESHLRSALARLNDRTD